MLPKTKLGKQMYRKLKVYAGDKHRMTPAADDPGRCVRSLADGMQEN